jgi:hypothetical protein
MAVFESFNPNNIEESEFTNLDEPENINHNITGNITENTMIIELGETGENSDLNNNQSEDETTSTSNQNNI